MADLIINNYPFTSTPLITITPLPAWDGQCV